MLTLVCSAGGPKAWKEMQQRQLEFYRGFDQEPAPASSNAEDEDSDAEYSQEVQAHLEESGRCQEAEGKPGEDDESVSLCPALHAWPGRCGLLISRSSTWDTCCAV